MWIRYLAAIWVALAVSAGAAKPSVAGYASIVIDAQSGQVLHEVNADTLNYPASLTKMMTLYVTFEALKGGRITLSKAVPVSEHAASQSPTKLGLRPGQTIMVADIIMALITKSANDAAVAIAEEIGGTEWDFAEMMTAKAAELGMTHTVFRNASGLPDLDQVSTARDLARLSQALIQNHPDYYGFFATRSFNYEGRQIESHNRFMKNYPGADGLKTGFIRASGFNLAGSAVRDGRRLIAVVLGGETAHWRDMHMAALMDRAFGSGGAALVASAEEPGAEDPMDDLIRTMTAQMRSPRPESARPENYASVTTVAMAPAVMTMEPVDSMAAAARAGNTGGGVTRASSSVGTAAQIATVKKAAAKPAPAPEPKGTWIIQVGVFSNKGSARKVAEEAADIADLPSSAKVGVSSVKQSGKQLYRARLTGITRAAALDACKKLERKKRDCLAVDGDA